MGAGEAQVKRVEIVHHALDREPVPHKLLTAGAEAFAQRGVVGEL